MLINPALSSKTAAQDLRNSRAADSSPAPAGAAPSAPGPGAAVEERLQRLAPLQDGAVPAIPDAAGADEVTGFFRANLSSQYWTALAAQANLDPESAYNLLQ